MNELDQKLDKAIMETIWVNAIDARVRERVHPYWFDVNGQTFTFGVDMKRIKQILKDAVRSGNNYGQHNGHLLSGQEWYERFMEEYNRANIQKIAGDTCHDKAIQTAARRAAGLEER